MFELLILCTHLGRKSEAADAQGGANVGNTSTPQPHVRYAMRIHKQYSLRQCRCVDEVLVMTIARVVAPTRNELPPTAFMLHVLTDCDHNKEGTNDTKGLLRCVTQVCARGQYSVQGMYKVVILTGFQRVAPRFDNERATFGAGVS